MNRNALLPPSYEGMIPANYLVRVVNKAVEKIELGVLLAPYKGGGTSSYHYRKPEVIRKYQFRAEDFGYDPDNDEFICPANKRLHFQYASRHITDNGYVTDRGYYECHQCSECPLKPQCTKSKGNRQDQDQLSITGIPPTSQSQSHQ